MLNGVEDGTQIHVKSVCRVRLRRSEEGLNMFGLDK